MLQRHIDILDDLGKLGNRVEQLRAYEVRIAVEQPYPAEFIDRREFAQQRRERRRRIEVAAIRSKVLRDQIDLTNPPGREDTPLGGQVGERPAFMQSANLR